MCVYAYVYMYIRRAHRFTQLAESLLATSRLMGPEISFSLEREREREREKEREAGVRPRVRALYERIAEEKPITRVGREREKGSACVCVLWSLLFVKSRVKGRLHWEITRIGMRKIAGKVYSEE